jgi:hypothetical protein
LIFAWEGFLLHHPDDWAPTTLSGDRGAGYVRIDSGGRLALQIRWKHSPNEVDLDARLESYFSSLRQGFAKNKQAFEPHVTRHGDRRVYKYSGGLQGKGVLFRDNDDSRVFFLELTSTSRNDRMLNTLSDIEASFEIGEERWAVLGLDVTLPGRLKMERKSFLSGKTLLQLSGRGVRVEAERWGFGDQLVAKHGLVEWARSAMAMPSATATEGEDAVALYTKGSLTSAPKYAVVKHQRERNQLSAVKVWTKRNDWRPMWDWLK